MADEIHPPFLGVVAEDFDGEEGELSLPEGTHIVVSQCDEDGWFTVHTKSKIGIFPGSYVDPLEQITLPAKVVVTLPFPELGLKVGDIATVQDIGLEGWMIESGNNIGYCTWKHLDFTDKEDPNPDIEFDIPDFLDDRVSKPAPKVQEPPSSLYDITPIRGDSTVVEPAPIPRGPQNNNNNNNNKNNNLNNNNNRPGPQNNQAQANKPGPQSNQVQANRPGPQNNQAQANKPGPQNTSNNNNKPGPQNTQANRPNTNAPNAGAVANRGGLAKVNSGAPATPPRNPNQQQQQQQPGKAPGSPARGANNKPGPQNNVGGARRPTSSVPTGAGAKETIVSPRKLAGVAPSARPVTEKPKKVHLATVAGVRDVENFAAPGEMHISNFATYRRPMSIFAVSKIERELEAEMKRSYNPYVVVQEGAPKYELEGRFEFRATSDCPPPPPFVGKEKLYVTGQPSFIDWKAKERSAFFDV